VADEDQDASLTTQLVHESEETGHFVLGERGCRLIHGDDARVQGDSMRDLDQLLPRQRELADWCSRIELDVQPI
jgi:hypothetical protein